MSGAITSRALPLLAFLALGPATPAAAGDIEGGAQTVLINGLAAAREGDVVLNIVNPMPPPPVLQGFVASGVGVGSVLIEGRPAAVVGSAVMPTGAIITGSQDVLIEGLGAARAGDQTLP